MFFFTHQHIPASILILSVAVIFSTCEDTSEITLNNELIFPEAHEIKVPSYVYQSVNGDIMIHGDEANNGNTVDTVNSEPVIRWDSVQTGLIVAAIFDQPIHVVSGIIENKNDIVWIWHSGLEIGRDGQVVFEEGKSIPDGLLDNLSQPVPLPALHQYFWGVWSWDQSGIRVTYSSRQMTFYVK
jgi:hypothetical protein